jgi:hypothetical protein
MVGKNIFASSSVHHSSSCALGIDLALAYNSGHHELVSYLVLALNHAPYLQNTQGMGAMITVHIASTVVAQPTPNAL